MSDDVRAAATLAACGHGGTLNMCRSCFVALTDRLAAVEAENARLRSEIESWREGEYTP